MKEDRRFFYFMATTKKVYLFRAAQFYKIGISGNHKSRLRQIQTGCPIKCEYIGYFPVAYPEKFEKILHTKFANEKTFGEWFNFGDDHIRILIAEHNLKHIINPYTTINEQTEITAATPALNKVRQLAADIQEIDKVYQGLYPKMELSDKGKNLTRQLVTKYGKIPVVEGLTKLSEKFDAHEVFKNLNHSARNYFTYGRHINDITWNAYYKVKKDYGIEDARKFLTFVMSNKSDTIARINHLIDHLYMQKWGENYDDIDEFLNEYFEAIIKIHYV